jgi:tetratricopeptide (TPR) repeat protein
MFRLYQAIECYDKAIQINPNNAGAYNNIGLVLYDLNKYNVLSKFFWT